LSPRKAATNPPWLPETRSQQAAVARAEKRISVRGALLRFCLEHLERPAGFPPCADREMLAIGGVGRNLSGSARGELRDAARP